MALSISNAFITLFTSEVHHAFQGARSLAGLVREKTGVVGSTVKFPRLGTGQATIRVPQSDIVPINLTYSQRTATMVDYVAGEYSEIFHQPKVRPGICWARLEPSRRSTQSKPLKLGNCHQL